ncbi:MAG: hypothetical protein PHD91_06745, partial [bacterium]|nr:hypothetical protein [bacterium]
PLCTLARQYIAEGAVGAPEHIMSVNYVPYGTVYFDNFYRDFESTGALSAEGHSRFRLYELPDGFTDGAGGGYGLFRSYLWWR